MRKELAGLTASQLPSMPFQLEAELGPERGENFPTARFGTTQSGVLEWRIVAYPQKRQPHALSREITSVNVVPAVAIEDDTKITLAGPLRITARRQPVLGTNIVPAAIMRNWLMLANSGLSDVTYTRLLRLAQQSEKPAWISTRKMSAESLASFLKFWMIVRHTAVEPDLVLLPNGNVQAEWYRDEKHNLDLEFLVGDSCIFGLFDGRNVAEGAESIASIESLLRAKDFAPVRWRLA